MNTLSKALSQIPGVTHGFGSVSDPVPTPLMSVWDRRPVHRQVHGVRTVELLFANQDVGEADALFSATAGIPVAVQTADCVPILLSRNDGHAVAAVHAGWRGTRARILKHLWQTLSRQGEHPKDWVAAIGPAIGPCCYEVSPELTKDFLTEFSAFERELVVPTTDHLDLQVINEQELKSIGVAEVEVIRACTRCAVGPDGTHLFHSFRREKAALRQWSGLVIAPARVPWVR